MAPPNIPRIDLTAEPTLSHCLSSSRGVAIPSSNIDVAGKDLCHPNAVTPSYSRTPTGTPEQPQSASRSNKRKRDDLGTSSSTPLKLHPFRKPNGEVVETPTYLASSGRAQSKKTRTARLASPEEVRSNSNRIFRRSSHGAPIGTRPQRDVSPCAARLARSMPEPCLESARSEATETVDVDGSGHLRRERGARDTRTSMLYTARVGPKTFADLEMEHNDLKRMYENLLEAYEDVRDEKEVVKEENVTLKRLSGDM